MLEDLLVAICSTEDTKEQFLRAPKFCSLRGRKGLFPFGVKCQTYRVLQANLKNGFNITKTLCQGN